MDIQLWSDRLRRQNGRSARRLQRCHLRALAREALNLINEELKHRVKNTLAVLGAVATQTFRDASSKADLEKYQGRLAAFGRAHDLLTAANWAAAPLQAVMSTALIPYRTGESRFCDFGSSICCQISTGSRSVVGNPRARDQRFEIRRSECGERPRVDFMNIRRSGGRAKINFRLARIWRPACFGARGCRLWFAPHFSSPTRRF
ncbi:HWE histidine kinase domain-containing protein [Bradyrhizobium sp. TZ2]